MRPEANHNAHDHARRFQEGDEAALAFFYREFHPALTLFAYQWVKSLQIGQEIASEAFVKTWKMHRKLDSYTGIRAYLYTIVRRDCQHSLRQERKRAKTDQMAVARKDCPDTPFQHLLRAETYRMVHAAIKTLSPGNRRVITMHFLEGKTTGQIARELDLHPHTVQTQKTRGLKALRKIIQHPLLLSFYHFVNFF